MSGLLTTAACTTDSGGKKSHSGDQAVIKELLNDPFLSEKFQFSQEASHMLGDRHGLKPTLKCQDNRDMA